MTEEKKVLGQIVVQEEWTETADGFSTTMIDLEEGLSERLVDSWVDMNLEPASISQYYDNLQADVPQEEALMTAVINEQIIDAILAAIELYGEQTEPDVEGNDGC